MTHYFIARRLFDAGRVLDKLRHIDPFTRREIDGQYFDVLGSQLWHGDIAYLAFLAIVIAISYFTYRWIEKPGREWVRNRIQTRQRSAPSRHIESACPIGASDHRGADLTERIKALPGKQRI
jgi:hypothetical protein